MIPERLFALLDQWISFGVVQRFHFMLKTLYVLLLKILNWLAENNDTLVIWVTTRTITLLDSDFESPIR